MYEEQDLEQKYDFMYDVTNENTDELCRENVPYPKVPESKKSVKKSGKAKGFFKKGIAVVTTGAVFGGVAGGVFNYIAGDQIRLLQENKTVTESTTEEMENLVDALTDVVTDTQTEQVVIPTTSVRTDASGMDVSAIAESVMPSVVAINVEAVVEQQDFFGYTQQYQTEGSGSGIIVGQNDTELLIVTNNHVVSDATTVNVTFIDDESYEAKVKGTDSDNDLAIIVVNLKDIKKDTMNKIQVASIGNSDDLKVGEQVVAIGNALGYGQSVTTGIVSAKDRMNDTNTTPLIQTDAAINPGNSGGALLNMKGEVVGINSSKYASTEVEGMGYAIPITAVQSTLDELMARKTRDKVPEEKRGFIGIGCGTVTSEASQMYGIPVGAIITEVYDDSAAADAGLKKNYIITKLDGQTVSGAEDLIEKLEYYAAGEKVTITYKYLSDSEYKENTVTVTLGLRPKNS